MIQTQSDLTTFHGNRLPQIMGRAALPESTMRRAREELKKARLIACFRLGGSTYWGIVGPGAPPLPEGASVISGSPDGGPMGPGPYGSNDPLALRPGIAIAPASAYMVGTPGSMQSMRFAGMGMPPPPQQQSRPLALHPMMQMPMQQPQVPMQMQMPMQSEHIARGGWQLTCCQQPHCFGGIQECPPSAVFP